MAGQLTRIIYLHPAGRASPSFGPFLGRRPAGSYDRKRCGEELSSPTHAHVDPYGHYLTGFCTGLQIGDEEAFDLERLYREGILLPDYPILEMLVQGTSVTFAAMPRAWASGRIETDTSRPVISAEKFGPGSIITFPREEACGARARLLLRRNGPPFRPLAQPFEFDERTLGGFRAGSCASQSAHPPGDAERKDRDRSGQRNPAATSCWAVSTRWASLRKASSEPFARGGRGLPCC